MTDRAIANYVFNQDSLPFLKVATQSGTTFTFLKALLILPQEQTATNVPPYVTSTTGFVPKDLAHPTIVRLNTQVNQPCHIFSVIASDLVSGLLSQCLVLQALSQMLVKANVFREGSCMCMFVQ